MKFIIRGFIENLGGAYDPCPIHDFDDETESNIPMVGDYLNWDPTLPTYKVVARHFYYSGARCALELEETKSPKLFF